MSVYGENGTDGRLYSRVCYLQVTNAPAERTKEASANNAAMIFAFFIKI